MKYPIVLQHSEEDYGAACLATTAKHKGSISAISIVKKYYKSQHPVENTGVTL